jgi:hypothetical protein
MEWSTTMQRTTWQAYGTSGTQALGHEEIEQAIARLERMWNDAQSHARMMTPISPRKKSAAITASSRLPELVTTNAR